MWDVPDIDLAALEVPWLDDFTTINRILFVGHVSLGYEQETRARLVPKGANDMTTRNRPDPRVATTRVAASG